MIVIRQFGIELVGLALHEAVEAVEAALQRPVVERPSRRCILHRGQVPLAHGKGGIPLLAQHFGHGGCVRTDVSPHVGKPGVEVGHGSHAHGVVVAAGDETGPGGRTQGRGVEVGVLQTALGQLVDIGRLDGRTVTPEMGETGIVQQDDHHVRAVVGRPFRNRPPRIGILIRPPDFPLEGLGFAHAIPPMINSANSSILINTRPPMIVE